MSKENKEDNFSERVIKYIATRCDEEFARLSVASIARQFKTDRYRLSRTFKAEMNVTLENYLLQEKMCRCAFLLMDDRNTTVKEVSSLMGFCTCDYFIQVFKKYFGIVPGQYKEYKTRRSGIEDRRTGNPDRRENPDGPLPECGNRRTGPKDRRTTSKDRRGDSPFLKKTAEKDTADQEEEENIKIVQSRGAAKEKESKGLL